MNQYEIVEVIEKIEGDVNSKPLSVSLEMQIKINEDGKKSYPYPILKVIINGREQFFFVDVAEKIYEMMGKLLPMALEKKAEIDSAFRARRESWEKRQHGNSNNDNGGSIGRGRIEVPVEVDGNKKPPRRFGGKDRDRRDRED